MTESFMTREELVIWLRDTISAETQKPEDQIDYEFVNECMALLSELITDKYNLSEEEIKAQARRITSSKKTEEVKKRPVKLKRMVIVAIAAAILLCGALTVFAISPAFRDMVMAVLNLDVGDSIEHNGVTYINAGEGRVYSDISELVEKEGLNIMYPHELPDGVEITEVAYFEEEKDIDICFNIADISMTLQFDVKEYEEYKASEEVLTFNNIDFYLHSRIRNDELWYSVYFIDYDNEILYSIFANDKTLIFDLMKTIY